MFRCRRTQFSTPIVIWGNSCRLTEIISSVEETSTCILHWPATASSQSSRPPNGVSARRKRTRMNKLLCLCNVNEQVASALEAYQLVTQTTKDSKLYCAASTTFLPTPAIFPVLHTWLRCRSNSYRKHIMSYLLAQYIAGLRNSYGIGRRGLERPTAMTDNNREVLNWEIPKNNERTLDYT
jgi:hypothetical protein